MVLSALLSPAAVGCAFLLVWGMCRIFPDSLHFAPRVPWILGAAIGSFLLVWLAARLPALFSRTQAAAFQGPVLGFPKIRSRKRFHLASLWNDRRFRFHPLGQLGCRLMNVILNLAVYGSVSEIFYQVQAIHSTKASYTDTQSIALERENFNTGHALQMCGRGPAFLPAGASGGVIAFRNIGMSGCIATTAATGEGRRFIVCRAVKAEAACVFTP